MSQGMEFRVNAGGVSVPDKSRQPGATELEARTRGKRRLAAAFRIFAEQGLSYGPGGHITYRDPVQPDHFWINPLGTDFSRIRVSDLVLVRDDGVIVQGGEPINAAGFAIHSTIHKLRPEVHAVAHSHSRFGTTFATLGRLLPPISQEACSFFSDHALYDGYGGAADASEAALIGRALGRNKAVICRNHGLFTVGASVDEAVFWFLRMERACEQTLRACAA
jgi:ribulose-5-phosphate 4-epimerase/fuculose-1-phosphate aldolase